MKKFIGLGSSFKEHMPLSLDPESATGYIRVTPDLYRVRGENTTRRPIL